MASSEGACGVRRFMCVLYTRVSHQGEHGDDGYEHRKVNE